MKYNLRAKEALTIEKSPKTDICSESEVNPNPSSALTQQMSNLTIENKFHSSPGSNLFIPDTADKLYKNQVLEHLLKETNVRYIGWAPDYDSWINSKSIRSYWCFKKPLSKLKRISKELPDKVDDLLINAESALYVDELLTGLNSERIRTDGNLPDIKRCCTLKSRLSAISLSMYGTNGQRFSLKSLLIALRILIQNQTGENSSDCLNAFDVPVTEEGKNTGGTTTTEF